MLVIYILSKIWKHGGEIYRDKNDGQLVLKNADNVPEDVLKASEPIFDRIDHYYKTVEGMNAVDLTTWKVMMCMCNWLNNDGVKKFLNEDEQAALLAVDYQSRLARHGWVDIYDDYRKYETVGSQRIKEEIYKRAIAFAKGVK